ncbi:MAG: PocR ligand-binding domain-containing protein [Oscillospiraceae bacterium]
MCYNSFKDASPGRIVQRNAGLACWRPCLDRGSFSANQSHSAGGYRAYAQRPRKHCWYTGGITYGSEPFAGHRVRSERRQRDRGVLYPGLRCKLPAARSRWSGALLRPPLRRQLRLCRRIAQLTGQTSHCEKVHLYGAYQAERFGGRHIYFCPSGMAYFAAPIIIGGRAAGSLVGGPVLIMDIDDYLAGSPPGMRDGLRSRWRNSAPS